MTFVERPVREISPIKHAILQNCLIEDRLMPNDSFHSMSQCLRQVISLRKVRIMNNIKRVVLACICLFGTAGCSAMGYGDGLPVERVLIRHHRFSPNTVEVPANTSFNMVFAVLDVHRTPVKVSAPSLGFSSLFVPGSARNPNAARLITYTDLKRAHVTIPPLSSGTYEFYCDCFGDKAVGRVVAK